MPNITATSAQVAIPQFWLAMALGHLKANLVMGRLVRRDADNVIAELGDTINITKRGSLTVRDKSEDTAVTADAPTNTKVAVKLDKHKYVAWYLEDTASAKAIDDALNYVQDGAAGLAEAIESDLLALHASVANEVGTAGTDISLATLLQARKQLNDQRCPMMGRSIIVSSKDEIALLDTDRLVEADKRGDSGEALSEAQLGRIYGFDAYMSQLVDVTAGSPDATHCLAFHGNAFMLASRPMPLPEAGSGAVGEYLVDPELNIALRYTRQWDATELKTKHVIDVLYGVQAIDEDRLAVEILT